MFRSAIAEVMVPQAQEQEQAAGERPASTAQGADELRLSTLFRDTPVRRIHSRVLDADVLLAVDDADVPADNELVVYRESELRALVGHPPAEVQRIHRVKAVFDGEVI